MLNYPQRLNAMKSRKSLSISKKYLFSLLPKHSWFCFSSINEVVTFHNATVKNFLGIGRDKIKYCFNVLDLET